MPTAQLTQLSRLERVGASHTQKFGLISPGFWAQGGRSPCGRILWLCSCLVIDSFGSCSGTGLAPALENWPPRFGLCWCFDFHSKSDLLFFGWMLRSWMVSFSSCSCNSTALATSILTVAWRVGCVRRHYHVCLLLCATVGKIWTLHDGDAVFDAACGFSWWVGFSWCLSFFLFGWLWSLWLLSNGFFSWVMRHIEGRVGRDFRTTPLCQFCVRSGMFSDADEGCLQAMTAEMYIRETESSIIRAFSRSCQWNLKETTWFIDCRKDVD